MRIYAVADIHGKADRLAALYWVLDRFKPDLVVAAGDLTNFFNWRTCLAQLDSLPVPVLAVRGNTDLRRTEGPMARAENLRLLTPEPFTAGGFSFVGASGAMPLPFASRICLRENRRLSAFPCPMDPDTVMVAHPPPRGICDRIGGKFSAGSRNLADFVRTAQPALLLCGHIHDQPGQETLGKTVVVNCTMGRSSLGAVIDLKKGGIPKVNLLHPADL